MLRWLTHSLAQRQLWSDTHFGHVNASVQRILRPSVYFGPENTLARETTSARWLWPTTLRPGDWNVRLKIFGFQWFKNNAVGLCTYFGNLIHLIQSTKKQLLLWFWGSNMSGVKISINEVKISGDQNLWGQNGSSSKWALLGKISSSLPDLIMMVIMALISP